MKTAETTIEKQISSIINPCRVLKVQEFLQIAEIVNPSIQGMSTSISNDAIALELMQRFEEMTQGKWVVEKHPENLKFLVNDKWEDTCQKVWQPALLTKERFVCEVEEPIALNYTSKGFNEFSEDSQKWCEAQSKIWFEGFEEFEGSIVNKSQDVRIFFKTGNLYLDGYSYKAPFITVFDLLYHITKYNETASNKIPLNWTDSFIKELVK